MKICTLLVAMLIVGLGSVAAQNPPPATSAPRASPQAAPSSSPSAAQNKIDPAKEADIRRLLDVTGIRKTMLQTMDSMTETMRPLLVSSLPPGEYREKLIDLFFERFRSKADIEKLVDFAVPIYDKYFSHEEIKGLIKFYETPIGQKALSVLPRLTLEMSQEGKKWGQKLGSDSMQEVLAEHPDLADALQAASKAAQQK